MDEQHTRRRSIRSFVKRTGRITPSQQRALHDLWPRFGLDQDDARLDLNSLFGRETDHVLEIGFGNGDTLVAAAVDHPDMDFLGLEVHEPGVGHCLLRAEDAGLSNIRIIIHDAIEVLRIQIADAALARINLYFPDPWPKKRHHKRRIVAPPFLDLAARKLHAGGTLHIATDWENYARHIDETMTGYAGFRLVERRKHSGDQPLERHTTKFETRGLKKGHHIWDWKYERVAD